MADQEETTEGTTVDETTAAAEAPATPSAKEQRAQQRHREASERPSRTPEERQAERNAERARKKRVRAARRVKEREARRAEPKQAPMAAAEKTEGRKKVRQGIVVSDKADKTITVRVDAARRHRRYQKIVRSSTTLHVHDESNEAREGDTVRVVESRPLSRLKRWKLVEVVEKAR